MAKKVVEWRFKHEWEEVKAWVFSDDRDRLARARDRMKCWVTRGRVPLAIEITLAVLNAVLLRHEQQVDHHTLVSVYSLTIIRFVNGFIDRQQQKQVAQSVSRLAASLSIPTHIVDMRHNATHQALPSLPSLELAVTEAFEWLKRHYWQRQDAVESRSFRHVMDQLSEYLNLLELAIAPPRGTSALAHHQAKAALSSKDIAADMLQNVSIRALCVYLGTTGLWTIQPTQQGNARASSMRGVSQFEHSKQLWKDVLCALAREMGAAKTGQALIAHALLHLETVPTTSTDAIDLHDRWLTFLFDEFCKGVPRHIVDFWFVHVTHLFVRNGLCSFQAALLRRLASSSQHSETAAVLHRTRIAVGKAEDKVKNDRGSAGPRAKRAKRRGGSPRSNKAVKVAEEKPARGDKAVVVAEESDAGAEQVTAETEAQGRNTLAWRRCSSEVWGTVPIGMLPGFVSPILRCTVLSSDTGSAGDGSKNSSSGGPETPK